MAPSQLRSTQKSAGRPADDTLGRSADPLPRLSRPAARPPRHRRRAAGLGRARRPRCRSRHRGRRFGRSETARMISRSCVRRRWRTFTAPVRARGALRASAAAAPRLTQAARMRQAVQAPQPRDAILLSPLQPRSRSRARAACQRRAGNGAAPEECLAIAREPPARAPSPAAAHLPKPGAARPA